MGENDLWAAVIAQAITDAVSNSQWGDNVVAKEQSKKWLTTDKNEFLMVCDFAGLDSNFVINIYQKILQTSGSCVMSDHDVRKIIIRKILTC